MTSIPSSVDPKDLSPSQQILLQKQKEHLGLLQLRDASKDLLERVEKLAEMQHVMADGGEGECSLASWGSRILWFKLILVQQLGK